MTAEEATATPGTQGIVKAARTAGAASVPAPRQVPDITDKPSPFALTVGALTEEEGYLNVLFYGAYGAGKTYLASTAHWVPEMRDVLYINVEAGIKAIVSQDITRIRVKDYRTFARVREYLRLHAKYRDEGNEERLLKTERWLRPGEDVAAPHHFRTVIIDSLSEVQKLCMYMLLGMDPETYQLDAVPASPEFAEWNQSTELIRLLIRQFRDLPYHIIIVLGEMEVEQAKGTNKTLLKRPNLQGRRLPGEVQGFLDVVGYLAEAVVDGETARRLYLRRLNESFNAKNRFHGNPPRYIDNPTMQDLWNLEVASRAAANASSPNGATSRPERSAARPSAPASGGTRTGTVRGRGPVRGPGNRVVRREQ